MNRMRVFRMGEIGVFVVTVAELQYGVSKSERVWAGEFNIGVEI